MMVGDKGEMRVTAIRMHKLQGYGAKGRGCTVLGGEHEPALPALQMQKGVRPCIKI
jgi:hypothetical protein